MFNFYLATNEGSINYGFGTIKDNLTTTEFLERYRLLPMSDLLISILDGNAFVKISTVDHPLDKIGGTI
ncbi:MAG: hypothetical protein P0116_16265 [Candidatus Nitrosocosmicus sp.]|nr:hypothetical protein [Candidatus Nitrosocosmicus sp.]